MTLRTIVGLDIGGANLKAVVLGGWARSLPFPLWRNPTGLTDALRQLLGDQVRPDLLAVTMTGELCDCFASKREGVLSILASVEALAQNWTPPPLIQVWRIDGRFVPLREAREDPLLAAAANWLATATFACRFLQSKEIGLLIDIGSTTTDLVPLQSTGPTPAGRTDLERMRCGELVYTGVRRTPICALLEDVAAELFATMQDAFLVLGQVSPSDSLDSADGRPATVLAAHARLARMLGADQESSTEEERLVLAQRAIHRQCSLIESRLEQVCARLSKMPACIILAGEGEFLGEQIVRTFFGHSARLATLDTPARSASEGRKETLACASGWCPGSNPPGERNEKSGLPTAPRLVRLDQNLSPEVSQAACAYAVAVLAEESGRRT